MTPETAEKKAIRDYLRYKGFFVYHNLAGLGVFPGIPDLTAIDDKGTVYQIEVKTPKGRQSERQREFQDLWESHNGIYILGGLDEVINAIK